jgi:hypothetical protein
LKSRWLPSEQPVIVKTVFINLFNLTKFVTFYVDKITQRTFMINYTEWHRQYLIVHVFLSFCLSVSLPFCLSVFLSFCLSVSLPFCLFLLSIFLPFCLSVFLSFCLYIFLTLCLSVFLSFCLSVFLKEVYLSLTELRSRPLDVVEWGDRKWRADRCPDGSASGS